jgi:hypothetical protein
LSTTGSAPGATPFWGGLKTGYTGGSTGGYPPSGDFNAANLAYTRGGIASDPTAGVTANLLDPNWGPAVYDTERKGAELAVSGGYSGSPLAGYQTSRMRAADIERRAALANSLLSGAAGRVPQPVDQISLRGQDINREEFGQNLALQQEQERLRREEFEWQKQQEALKNSGYRYQSGRGGYSPLPQYRGGFGTNLNSYDTIQGGAPGSTGWDWRSNQRW